MTSKPRKQAAAPKEEATRVEDQTVAKAPAEPTAPAVDAPAQAAAPSYPRCVNCGARAIYETDGKATTKRGYCAKDLPANVNQAMVEQYQRLARQ